MEDNVGKSRSNIGWGIPVSVIAHLLFAVVAIVGLPLELPQPPEEEAVTVEIVEPPPEPEPVPEPEPELEPQPEPPPEPEEQEAEPEPEPEPAPDTLSEEMATERAAPPTSRQVFEFEEETTGPKVSPEGNASTEAATEPQETDVSEEEGMQSEAPEMPADTPAEDGDAATAEAYGATDEPAETEEAEEQTEHALPPLTEAQTIFSEDMTDDPVARIAMDDVPRGLRASLLCETELTGQLRNASPPRNPEFIPRLNLTDGNVLELRRTAFHADGEWHDLSFRCVVNSGATKVVSFAFEVGEPVPRSQWRSRGIPGI